MVACSLTHSEIVRDWEWLHTNLTSTLQSFDTEEEITDFVCCKIQSIIANNASESKLVDGMSDLDRVNHNEMTQFLYHVLHFSL